MKKVLFYLGYLLTLAIPLAIYLPAVGFGVDSYSLSVILGITAFIILCNQFILASRPSFAVKALGAKGLLALHRTAPAALILIVAAHFILKLLAGFSLASFRASLGIAVFSLLILFAASAAVLMANTVLSRISFLAAFKRWFNGKTGMTYKKARDLHNAFALVAVLAIVHALLASSSHLAVNPMGAAWLLLWMIISQAAYARYRLTGRKGSDASRTQQGSASAV